MKLRPRSSLTLEQYLRLFPKHARVVIFDLETTGLDPKYDEIVEIGAVELINLIETRSFSQLANPSKLIPDKVTAVHGLSNYLLRACPSCPEAIKRFLDWIGPQNDLLLVGHNIQFDVGFLKNGVEALNSSEGSGFRCEFEEFCTLKFVESAFGGRICSLDRACRLFGVEEYKTRGLHSALVDSRLTGLLFTRLKMWDFFQDTKGLKMFPERKNTRYRPNPGMRKLPFHKTEEPRTTEERDKAKESARKKFAWMRQNWRKPDPHLSST